MPTPERVFRNRGIAAKDNILAPSEIRFLRDKEKLVLNEERMKLIVKKAEEYLEHELLVIPLSTYRRYGIDGNRAEMQSYYYPRREGLLALALAEFYERQGRFTNKLIDFLWAIMEESTWLISAHFYRHSVGAKDGVPNFFGSVRTHDVQLFAASTGALVALVYHFCRDIIDGVSPYITERMRYEVRERVLLPYMNKDFHWMGVSRPQSSNWLTWCTSNVLFAASIFADDKYEREIIAQRAMNSLDTFIESYNPDGGCDEGPAYWTAAGASLLDSLDTLYDMSAGKINIYDHPMIKAIGEYIVDVNLFDNKVVNFADSSPNVTPSMPLMIRFGEVTGSDVLTSFGKSHNTAASYGITSGHLYRAIRAIYEPQTPVEEAEIIMAKPTVYYDHINIAVIRESENKGEGSILAMKGGTNGEKHNHNDVGCFMVYSDKTPVIIDMGPATYINWEFANRDNTWHKYSDFHSLPTFNGAYQPTGKQYASKNEVFSAEERSFTIDITNAYGEDAGLVSYIRRGELRGSDVVITDKIELRENSEIIFYFTLPAEPKIEDGEFVLSADKRLSLNCDAELYFEKHETAAIQSKSWGAAIWRACFKLHAKSGEFVFTIK